MPNLRARCVCVFPHGWEGRPSLEGFWVFSRKDRVKPTCSHVYYLGGRLDGGKTIDSF